MYHDRLDEIVKSLPEGEAKDKLAEILKEESYDKVREKIKAFAAESADSDLSARLAALPGRGAGRRPFAGFVHSGHRARQNIVTERSRKSRPAPRSAATRATRC